MWNSVDHARFYLTYRATLKRCAEYYNAAGETDIRVTTSPEQTRLAVSDTISSQSDTPSKTLLANVRNNHFQAVSLAKTGTPDKPVLSILVLDSLPDDPSHADFLRDAVPHINNSWKKIIPPGTDATCLIVNTGTQLGALECGDFALQHAKYLSRYKPILTKLHQQLHSRTLLRELNVDIANKEPASPADERRFHLERISGNPEIYQTNAPFFLRAISPRLLADILKRHQSAPRRDEAIRFAELDDLRLDPDHASTLHEYLTNVSSNNAYGEIYAKRLRTMRKARAAPQNTGDSSASMQPVRPRSSSRTIWAEPPFVASGRIPLAAQPSATNMCGPLTVDMALFGSAARADTKNDERLKELLDIAVRVGFSSRDLHEYYSNKFAYGRRGVHGLLALPSWRGDLLAPESPPLIAPVNYRSGQAEPLETGISGLFSLRINEHTRSRFHAGDPRLTHHFVVSSEKTRPRDKPEITAPRFCVMTSRMFHPTRTDRAHWVVIGHFDDAWQCCNATALGRYDRLCAQHEPTPSGAVRALLEYTRRRLKTLEIDDKGASGAYPCLHVEVLVPKIPA